MEKKYYIVGLRPVIREIFPDMNKFYAMEWDTGEFKLDMRYNHEILFDPSGESREVDKKEFDEYVTNKRNERELPQTPY